MQCQHSGMYALPSKLSSLSDTEVIQLIAELKAGRGDSLQLPTGKATYTVVAPKLPSFSGNHDKPGSYEQWRSHLKSLINDDAIPESQILSAIHQSVRGTAGSVLLSMPEHSTSPTIVDKFDKYFGNILP